MKLQDDTISRLLEHDPAAARATRGFFENYPLERSYVKGAAALLIGTSDHRWIHCLGEAGKDLAALLSEHHAESPYYYAVADEALPLVLACGDADWVMSTRRYVLEEGAGVPEPRHRILPLNVSLAEYIYANTDYREFTDPAYIRDRLDRDISAGIAVDGTLAAWGLTHDDGALGFLHVLKTHRRCGLGRDILLALIALKRKAKRPVFCNIVPENVPAMSLLEGLGFRFDGMAHWVKMNCPA
ncbi:MAG: GNAT family N-acetyltransferase [Candidatus Marinimicrobia bacterium]|nr:GNAT family N-acetyltransferase [Candidatus Neomarinimicrobiota bacterium]